MNYLVNGKLVDHNGNPVATETASPFADLSPAVQKALETAGITTVEQAQTLGEAGLVALPDVGEVTAKKILAL